MLQTDCYLMSLSNSPRRELFANDTRSTYPSMSLRFDARVGLRGSTTPKRRTFQPQRLNNTNNNTNNDNNANNNNNDNNKNNKNDAISPS